MDDVFFTAEARGSEREAEEDLGFAPFVSLHWLCAPLRPLRLCGENLIGDVGLKFSSYFPPVVECFFCENDHDGG